MDEGVTAAAKREAERLAGARGDSQTQQFLAVAQEQLDIYSTAWFLCKLGAAFSLLLALSLDRPIWQTYTMV